MNSKKYFNVEKEVLNKVLNTQHENIIKAANIIAECIESGGIIQAFGSGHSYGTALEACGRAGGYIPSKAHDTKGLPETVEGFGTDYMKSVNVEENDVFIVISNSGRNPLGIEIAIEAKKKGAKIIVLTSLQTSKLLQPLHSGNKLLYEYADCVLDNCAPEGDVGVKIEKYDKLVSGISAIPAAFLIQCVIIESIDILVKKGFNPPIYMSMNIDEGVAFNDKMIEKYAHRIYRI